MLSSTSWIRGSIYFLGSYIGKIYYRIKLVLWRSVKGNICNTTTIPAIWNFLKNGAPVWMNRSNIKTGCCLGHTPDSSLAESKQRIVTCFCRGIPSGSPTKPACYVEHSKFLTNMEPEKMGEKVWQPLFFYVVFLLCHCPSAGKFLGILQCPHLMNKGRRNHAAHAIFSGWVGWVIHPRQALSTHQIALAVVPEEEHGALLGAGNGILKPSLG